MTKLKLKSKINFISKIIGIVFIVTAMINIILGVRISVDFKQHKKRCTDTVISEVVGNITVKTTMEDEDDCTRTVTNYKPVFNFSYGGQDYRVESDSFQTPPLFDVGEKAEIKVNPSDPSEIYVPADKSAGRAGIIGIAVGMIFLIVGIIFIVKF